MSSLHTNVDTIEFAQFPPVEVPSSINSVTNIPASTSLPLFTTLSQTFAPTNLLKVSPLDTHWQHFMQNPSQYPRNPLEFNNSTTNKRKFSSDDSAIPDPNQQMDMESIIVSISSKNCPSNNPDADDNTNPFVHLLAGSQLLLQQLQFSLLNQNINNSTVLPINSTSLQAHQDNIDNSLASPVSSAYTNQIHHSVNYSNDYNDGDCNQNGNNGDGQCFSSPKIRYQLSNQTRVHKQAKPLTQYDLDLAQTIRIKNAAERNRSPLGCFVSSSGKQKTSHKKKRIQNYRKN